MDEKFKNGCTSVTHEEGAGCMSTATTEDNIERVCDMALKLVQRWKKCIEKRGDYVEK
jgi:hypothetical protein